MENYIGGYFYLESRWMLFLSRIIIVSTTNYNLTINEDK